MPRFDLLEDPMPSPAGEGREECFETVVGEWLQFRARAWTSNGTATNYRLFARGWITILGDLPVRDIRPRDVQRLYLALDNGKRSGMWLDKSRDTLHSFFSWCIGLELACLQPVNSQAWPRLGRKKRSSRSREQIEITPSILERILCLAPIRYHRCLSILFILGLRIGEAFASRYGWIEPDHRDPTQFVLKIPRRHRGEERKQATDYVIPLGQRALGIIGPFKAPEERIFAEVPSKSAIRQMLHRIGLRLGIDRLGCHQFRRSTSTALANSGMPLAALQRFMGWTGPPHEVLDQLDSSYYLGIEGPRARAIQDRLWPDRR